MFNSTSENWQYIQFIGTTRAKNIQEQFDGVQIYVNFEIAALFPSPYRRGEWNNPAISKQTYFLIPSGRSYIVLALAK